MFAEEHKNITTGATVNDSLMGLLLLERVVRSGQITPPELAELGAWRNRQVALIAEATGINIDAAQAPAPEQE